jgi:hypothetical protein
MEVSPSPSLASRFDPLIQPFHLLGIDPAATKAEVEAAYVRALQQRGASERDLTHAFNAILDPARRLSCELAYPIDSSPAQLETFYADLSGDELLSSAARLPPLSRANFVACLAARRPAEADVVVALVDAHVSIDATEIYTTLKAFRHRAGCPSPSLVHVGQGLSELLAIHVDAAIGGYHAIPGATEPMLECARRILATGERYRVEVLSELLNAYRRSTAELRVNACRRIEGACLSLKQHPEEAPSLDELSDALRLWNSLCGPLILLDADQGCQDPDVEIAVDQARDLLTELIVHRHHATARKVVNLARDAFSLVPGAIEHFNETASLLDGLWFGAELKPLRDVIEQVEADPSLLLESLGKDGLGESSSQQARGLWQVFCQAVQATKSSGFADQPWWTIRDLALRLGNRPETAAAAPRLMVQLIRYGESALLNPALLDMLRDDLLEVERRHPASPAKGRGSKHLGKRSLWACSALAGVLCSVTVYRYFDADSWHFLGSAPVPPAVQATAVPQPEVVPPIGKGQHFSLEYVRYCHFQQERLRVIKQEVNGPQDIQAFNILANDYNSRCSNFYYLDEDLKIVIEEVNAKEKVLEADAKRILATWPWHSASGRTLAPPTK